MLQKRRRSHSVSSAPSAGSSSSSSSDDGRSTSSSASLSTPAHKQSRLPSAAPSELSWTCSLKPTCAAKPQHFATARELEAHYARVHELACEAIVGGGSSSSGMSGLDAKGKGRMNEQHCGCVFPERRLLELHQNEFHNPLLAELAARGERIYECLLPSALCDHRSRTPKGRRLHMIDKHLYPREYFFGVVKVGIGQLLLTQGMAASLLRPPHVVSSAHEQNAPMSIEPPQPSAAPARTTPKADREVAEDDDLDGLASRMAASLAFTPRSVQRKVKMVIK